MVPELPSRYLRRRLTHLTLAIASVEPSLCSAERGKPSMGSALQRMSRSACIDGSRQVAASIRIFSTLKLFSLAARALHGNHVPPPKTGGTGLQSRLINVVTLVCRRRPSPVGGAGRHSARASMAGGAWGLRPAGVSLRFHRYCNHAPSATLALKQGGSFASCIRKPS